LKISERVKDYRMKHGFTQEEMARRLDISQPSYSCYESGETKPNVMNAIKLSNLLNVSIEELMKEE